MFCSKCGMQINNDALFCTFCGSPTILASPPSPVRAPAAAPVIGGVPVPQSIPTSSEIFAAGSIRTASQSIPAPNAGYRAETPPAEESVIAERAGEFTQDAAETLPFTEGTAPGSAETAEPTEKGFIYEPEQEYGARTVTEQPFAPPQPDFAIAGSSAELATAGGAALSSSIQSAQFAQTVQPVPVQTAPSEGGSEKPTKYYTFGHIALCLAAVGVMAIVAGVFAGLYFSVI